MAGFTKFEEIEAWKRARELCKLIYKITLNANFSRDFSLKDQIRRSSGSVMDNIAEGFERGGKKEFIQFLYISKSSSAETKSKLYRALDYEYINKEEFESCYEKCNECSKILAGLINYLKSSEIKGPKYL
ncbi:MAG: four helix bundle protein [Bacteroidales bacterium]|jgi:four helix bundle protein|nr:four helix bundle protein [Bacteroidales bacterium]